MFWSQTMQTENLHDQMTILVGSAIRLLCGEAGVFVVSNEAFDPQSSPEYTLYRLSSSSLPALLRSLQDSRQPNSTCILVRDTLPSTVVDYLNQAEELKLFAVERCSLLVHDHAGVLGVLHFLRPEHTCSCLEQDEGARGTLPLFVAQLAAGLRSALKSHSLVKEQGRLAAIFQHSMEGILTVDTMLRIIDFNPAMERLTGWHESEVLGRFYYDVLRPKDRQGNEVGLQGSPILQAFAGQSVVNREMVISTRDGQRFDVSVTALCIRSSKGEPMNGILNVRDVTREHEQEEAALNVYFCHLS